LDWRIGWGDEADELAAGFERYAKTTRRAVFLAEMERVVPWPALRGLERLEADRSEEDRDPCGVTLVRE
jgi:hypothetical protein